ncbi:hypothetical protein SUNI508_04554 [Seiridium unicorne]|uniref:Amine oxidase domain-containing protein n=1 Tax=Seiridium unicorne TaxID=138068 RepID=A0ABR2V7K9_9PEZI
MEDIEVPRAPGADSYKYEWARYVARRTLDEDLENLKVRIEAANVAEGIPIPQLQLGKDASVRDVVRAAQDVTGPGVVPPAQGKFKIAIVGAGVGGLFTAMIFDWLNKQFENSGSLEIDYDIMEAAEEDRLGGRLYTHYFSELSPEDKSSGKINHDYYDVGAMRFPKNHIMSRTFELFTLLGLNENQPGGLIPYYLADNANDKKGVCPSYFNDVHQVGNIWKPEMEADPYKLNAGLPEGAQISQDVLKENPSTIVSKALQPFITEFKRLHQERKDAKRNSTEEEERQTGFWKFLMAADNMSVRQFLSSGKNEYPIPHGPEYNYNTIEWLETATYGTGWYDQSLSETVLEELDFDTDPNSKEQLWWCVEGGTQKIARLMKDKIAKPVQFGKQVVSINAHVDERADPHKYVPVTLDIQKIDSTTKQPVSHRRKDYFAVFNSTTLAALQRMDLHNAGLLWGTKQAIRALGYGASCKVAIKFKTPWWQIHPYNINLGGVSRTDLPLRVCVYPSYNIEKHEGENWRKDKPAVLLCSYTWGQDAQRIGSLISPDTPKNEEQLKSLLLRNLALLHANGEGDHPDYDSLLEFLEDQYETHHAWDWYRDEHMSGAFAYFGPGQFSNMWQEIIKPNAFGQLYLVGEAASSHHAWIVGALESVVRAVFVMFEGLQSNDPGFEPYTQAMNLLRHGTKAAKYDSKAPQEPKLPFWPLPSEMPERQKDTKKGEKQADLADQNLPLTYAAAVAALSLVECYFELVVPTLGKV